MDSGSEITMVRIKVSLGNGTVPYRTVLFVQSEIWIPYCTGGCRTDCIWDDIAVTRYKVWTGTGSRIVEYGTLP